MVELENCTQIKYALCSGLLDIKDDEGKSNQITRNDNDVKMIENIGVMHHIANTMTS